MQVCKLLITQCPQKESKKVFMLETFLLFHRKKGRRIRCLIIERRFCRRRGSSLKQPTSNLKKKCLKLMKKRQKEVVLILGKLPIKKEKP